MLYDADRVHEMAASEREQDLYKAQLSLFLNPHEPEVQRQAASDGIPYLFPEAAKNSPIHKLVCQWKIDLPSQPVFSTLPMC